MRALLAGVALALSSPALACGYCVEDRIAAAYDHSVIFRALERNNAVAFLGIEGALPAGNVLKRKLRAAAESVAGVERGSVRVSVESASLSFAFDPVRRPINGILLKLNGRLKPIGLSASILRVFDR